MTIERNREVQEHDLTRITLADAEAEVQSSQAAFKELELTIMDKQSQPQSAGASSDQRNTLPGNVLAELRHLRKENAELHRDKVILHK